MTRLTAPFLSAALLAACSPGTPARQEPTNDASPGAPDDTAAAPLASPASPPERTANYTRLDDCPVVRRSDEEMAFVETLCAGPQGWSLKIGDSDARQTLSVIAPGGQETRIDTARIGGGGFSNFGKSAEWRGPAGASPDALVVRYQVAEQPYPAPETSYLLAIRLTPRPCITARVAPGARQNDRAAQAADDARACLTG